MLDLLYILSSQNKAAEAIVKHRKPLSKEGRNGNCNSATAKENQATETSQTSYNLKRDEVPTLFWEPGILEGYRAVNQPWMYYLKSLFKLHNETFNVWTHLLAPFVYITLVYRLGSDLDYRNNPQSWGILVLAVTSVLSGLGSAAAHLFHSRSELAHYVMFSLDYMCIALYGYGFGVMLFYSSGNEFFYNTLGSLFPVIHVICAVNITLCNSLARVVYGHRQCISRKLMQAGSAALSVLWCEVIPIFRLSSCWINNTWATDTITYHIPYHFFTITNAILFSKHQPERSFPGRFDIFGHGHQWFHVSCILCICFQFYACYVDLLNLPKDMLQIAQPTWTTMLGNLSLVIIINIVILLIFYPKFRKCAKTT